MAKYSLLRHLSLENRTEEVKNVAKALAEDIAEMDWEKGNGNPKLIHEEEEVKDIAKHLADPIAKSGDWERSGKPKKGGNVTKSMSSSKWGTTGGWGNENLRDEIEHAGDNSQVEFNSTNYVDLPEPVDPAEAPGDIHDEAVNKRNEYEEHFTKKLTDDYLLSEEAFAGLEKTFNSYSRLQELNIHDPKLTHPSSQLAMEALRDSFYEEGYSSEDFNSFSTYSVEEEKEGIFKKIWKAVKGFFKMVFTGLAKLGKFLVKVIGFKKEEAELTKASAEAAEEISNSELVKVMDESGATQAVIEIQRENKEDTPLSRSDLTEMFEQKLGLLSNDFDEKMNQLKEKFENEKERAEAFENLAKTQEESLSQLGKKLLESEERWEKALADGVVETTIVKQQSKWQKAKNYLAKMVGKEGSTVTESVTKITRVKHPDVKDEEQQEDKNQEPQEQENQQEETQQETPPEDNKKDNKQKPKRALKDPRAGVWGGLQNRYSWLQGDEFKENVKVYEHAKRIMFLDKVSKLMGSNGSALDLFFSKEVVDMVFYRGVDVAFMFAKKGDGTDGEGYVALKKYMENLKNFGDNYGIFVQKYIQMTEVSEDLITKHGAGNFNINGTNNKYHDPKSVKGGEYLRDDQNNLVQDDRGKNIMLTDAHQLKLTIQDILKSVNGGSKLEVLHLPDGIQGMGKLDGSSELKSDAFKGGWKSGNNYNTKFTLNTKTLARFKNDLADGEKDVRNTEVDIYTIYYYDPSKGGISFYNLIGGKIDVNMSLIDVITKEIQNNTLRNNENVDSMGAAKTTNKNGAVTERFGSEKDKEEINKHRANTKGKKNNQDWQEVILELDFFRNIAGDAPKAADIYKKMGEFLREQYAVLSAGQSDIKEIEEMIKDAEKGLDSFEKVYNKYSSISVDQLSNRETAKTKASGIKDSGGLDKMQMGHKEGLQTNRTILQALAKVGRFVFLVIKTCVVGLSKFLKAYTRSYQQRLKTVRNINKAFSVWLEDLEYANSELDRRHWEEDDRRIQQQVVRDISGDSSVIHPDFDPHDDSTFTQPPVEVKSRQKEKEATSVHGKDLDDLFEQEMAS